MAKGDKRTAYKKLPTCTKTVELRDVGNILPESERKYENKARRI